MDLTIDPAYQALVELAASSHTGNRNPGDIAEADVERARLYAYGFRNHVIGAFHATGVALEDVPAGNATATAWRQRAVEGLRDLVDLAMDAVPDDFRVVISTFHAYHRGVTRVDDSLARECAETRCDRVATIRQRFRDAIHTVTASPGIVTTQDTHAPEQAGFVVPNLGITIVPLIYGDHHSWNLAWLGGEERNVPTHRHFHGVEIHLGYNPAHGMTVLGDYRCEVDEGYAMPIPPVTDHGWVNTSEETHHVPFIFGSLHHAGWGVFLDVEARPQPVEDRQLVDRDSPTFSQMVYLEHHIDQAAAMASTWRRVLIPHTVTNRSGSGGLELAITRINPVEFSFPVDSFRIVSVVRGRGRVRIGQVERDVESHDHFGIPAGMEGTLIQLGDDPLVVLDSTIRSSIG